MTAYMSPATPIRSVPTSKERGATLIIIALVLTALMIAAALFVDGGNSYSVRRSMQNAADAGAMAGARALYNAIQLGAITVNTTSDVYDQAFAVAITADGGSVPTDGEDFCDFVDSTGNLLGPCTTTGVAPGTAVGVRVNVENSRRPFFGNFAGSSSVTVRGRAAASIQQVGGTGAPWIICGTSGSPNNGWPFLSTGGDTEDSTDTGIDADDALLPYTTLLPKFGWKGVDKTNPPTDKKSDPNAPLLIQGPSGNGACGSSSSSADGKGGGGVLGNGMVSVSPGNGSNTITNSNTSVPVGTCYSNVTCVPCPTGTYQPELNATVQAGCDLLLPISDWAVGVGSNAGYHVVTEAVFHIETGQGSDKIIGWLDDPAKFTVTPSFSQAGNCTPGSQLCVVKLVDFPTNGLLE